MLRGSKDQHRQAGRSTTYLLVPNLKRLAPDRVHDREESGLESILEHG